MADSKKAATKSSKEFLKESFDAGNNTRDATSKNSVSKLPDSLAHNEPKPSDSTKEIRKAGSEYVKPVRTEYGSNGKSRIQREFQGRKRTEGRRKATDKDFSEKKSDFTESEVSDNKKAAKTGDDKRKARKKYENNKVIAENTTYSMQRVFDEDTGTYTYKVMADKKSIGPNKTKRKKKISGRLIYEVSSAGRTKGMEGQDDNDAVDAANTVEQTGERLYEFAREHGKSKAQRKYEKVVKAEKKPAKAETVFEKRKFQFDTKKAYEQWIMENPSVNEKNIKNLLKKRIQKSRIKRQYQKIAKNAKTTGKAIEESYEASKTTTIIFHKIREYIANNSKIVIVVGIFTLIFFMIMGMFSSCASMFGNAITTTISGSFLSMPAEIDGAALIMTELETELQEQINNIETEYPDYDEYDYNLGEIGHDPAMLISYLSAKYTEFTAIDVRSEIEEVFGEMYTLTLTPDTETRTRMVTKTRIVTDPDTGIEYEEEYEEEEEYEVSILKVELEVKTFEEIAGENLSPEQKEMFDVYTETRGALQVFASPVDYYWYDYISSYYGYRIHPITGEKQFHRGVDIAVMEGTTVYATHEGIITEAGYDDSFGNYIVITDNKGYTTKYGHLSQINVSTGQSVRKGKVIGKTGNTGASTGSHLHFECMYQGEYYNPLFYFNCGTKTMYGESTGGSGKTDYGLPASFSDAQVEALLKEADKYVGTDYVWGGSNPSTGFDCSGFVCWAFKASGAYPLERTTAQVIYNKCADVAAGSEKPGDIIFFTGTYNSGNPVSHVGIVVSPGIMVHAGDPIKYSSYTTSYWQSHFYGFGRLAN